jgi:hypothetical protein
MPYSMTPHTPSLFPSNFIGITVSSATIHSKRVDLLLHRRSARDASSVLIAFAVVIALMLPIKQGLFFVGNIIGLALPTNLLGMDGLKRGERILFSFYEPQSSPLLRFLGDCFLGSSLLPFVFRV